MGEACRNWSVSRSDEDHLTTVKKKESLRCDLKVDDTEIYLYLEQCKRGRQFLFRNVEPTLNYTFVSCLYQKICTYLTGLFLMKEIKGTKQTPGKRRTIVATSKVSQIEKCN